MSHTFSLVCHATRQRVWIGQGWGSMQSLYSGNPETMDALMRFLNDHIGQPLEFLCDDRAPDSICEYGTYETRIEANNPVSIEAYNRWKSEREKELSAGIDQPACGCRFDWTWIYDRTHYLPIRAAVKHLKRCDGNTVCQVGKPGDLGYKAAIDKAAAQIEQELNRRAAEMRAKFDRSANESLAPSP